MDYKKIINDYLNNKILFKDLLKISSKDVTFGIWSFQNKPRIISYYEKNKKIEYDILNSKFYYEI